MVSPTSAIASSVIPKPVRAVEELLTEPAGMVTVISLPAPGAVKSAASVPAPAVNDNVTTVATPIWEVVPAKEAVTRAALPSPSSSNASAVTFRVMPESLSVISKAVSTTASTLPLATAPSTDIVSAAPSAARSSFTATTISAQPLTRPAGMEIPIP